MKNLLLSMIALFLVHSYTIAQNPCSKYYPLKEGVKYQVTSYNKKDKPIGTTNYEVKEFNGNKAILFNQVLDKKGKLIVESDYTIYCNENGISIDFKSMMSPDLFEQYKSMEIDLSGNNIEIPNHLNKGQKLPDANMDIAINMVGIKMNISINMSDRVVEGKESITTPSGFYDCVIISYKSEVKMGSGMNRKGTSKQWFSEGIGMVKSEEYDNNGNLTSYSLLTSYSK